MLEIISLIGWLAVWGSTTILSIIFGAWMIVKTYPVDEYEYRDVFFDEGLWRRDKTAIIAISILCWIPFLNLIVGMFSLLYGLNNNDFNFKPITGAWNPMLRLMRKLLKHEYLLDKVVKEG